VLFFLTDHYAMKVYWRSGSIELHILCFGTRWRYVVSFTPRPLCPQEKSPWYPPDKRVGGRVWLVNYYLLSRRQAVA